MTTNQLKMVLDEGFNVYENALRMFSSNVTEDYDGCVRVYNNARVRLITISTMVDIMLDDEKDQVERDMKYHYINRKLDEYLEITRVLYDARMKEINKIK